jgi:hypothetical protein
MRFAAILSAGALILTSSAAAFAKPDNPEAELAKALEGRVAGKPVDCISIHNIRGTRIIDRTAIVYDTGRTIYVNRPSGARTLDKWDVMVNKPFGSQLCRIDNVNLIDSTTRMTSGFVLLNEFVPYTKVRQ